MSERDVLTVEFFPEKIPFPKFTTNAYLRQTAEDMLSLLSQPQVTTPAVPLEFGPPILNTYRALADILRRSFSLPAPPATTTHPIVIPVALPRVPTPVPPSTLANTLPRVQIPIPLPTIRLPSPVVTVPATSEGAEHSHHGITTTGSSTQSVPFSNSPSTV